MTAGWVDRTTMVQAEQALQERAARERAADDARSRATAEAETAAAARPRDVGAGPGPLASSELVEARSLAEQAVEQLRVAVEAAGMAASAGYLSAPRPGSVGALYESAGHAIGALEVAMGGAIQQYPPATHVTVAEGYLLQANRLAQLRSRTTRL